MIVDWNSTKNELLLNPRLPTATRELFESAWCNLVEPRFQSQIGIATSGSSGDSHGKLIVLSKSAVLESARAVNEHLKASSQDVWMKSLPDFHVGGVGIFARAHLNGAKVFESRLVKWSAQGFYDEILSSRATLLALVPTQLFDLVALGLRAPEFVRAIVIGGGRLEKSLHERAIALGWPALSSYGCTECCSQVATALAANDPRMMPLAHVQLRIGEHDRLEIQSKALLTGQIVFGKNGATFVDPKKDGWFQTEDRARIESDGSLTILGRTADFVKIGGEGVVMSRLEERLERLRLNYPFDVAVLAASDDRLGARVVMLSAGDESLSKNLVSEFNNEILPFERVREVHHVAEIPRSPLGKLLRAQALALVGLKPATDVERD